MSEFNIKQQNRNRFKASKEKKQAARFKQSEKLGRNQYVERQSNASESSESVEMPVEKKRTPRSEKRKNREKKKNDDSNQKERVDRSVANRELDNPSPCSSKSPKWSNQNTKENNPFIFQSSQKGKPWKVAVNSEQSNNSPRQFEKVKYEKNETKSSTYVPVSPVAKLQRTNFQWFNPSAVQADSDDGIIANESSKKHCTKKTNESSKNHSTKKSNESLNNKPQRNINSQKGQNTQKSVPFTTAGLSQNEMKTVRGLFSEPSTSKSIDSDLSDKYDCSRGSKNNVSDFRSQQPTSNDKSREESSIDQSGNSKKYRKRAIKSHANRNYDLPSYEENEDDLEGEGFDDLSKATFSVSSHFLMKEQKEWLEQSESCINPFAWNLKCLAAALHTIPFHQRQSLPENLFTSNEITHLTSEADSKLQNYEDVRREAEEGGKTEVCREADDDILKDDFISDFLTCRDSFSTDKSNGGAENDGGFVISNARTSYLLNLDLDQDDFESQFSTHTIVSQNEDDLKKAKKKNRKSKNKSNQNKTVAGKSVEVEHSGKLLRSDSDLSNLLRSSSEEEAVKHNEQKSKLKNNTSSSPAKITRFGKTRKEILVGDKSNTTQNAKEKQQNVDSTCSSVLADRVVEGNVSSSEDALCPSQSTEKRTRIRGSSAFNITESLSDLIAGKSSLTSEPISSPNMESFKTSAKSSSVPNSKEDSLATSFKRLNFGSPTNYKFDFKMSSPTLHSKASNPFELKTFSPSPSKKTNNFHDSTSNTSNTFKTQIFTPSPPKKSSVETKRASSKPSKLVCKFDYRIREEDTEENSSSIPSLVVTPSKKATPAIDIAKKSSASNALSRSAGGASSLASASPSSSGSKPVIDDDDDDDDDEIDSLLGITSHTPNDKTGSRCASDEHLPIANKEKQQAASDSKQPSTSMLDENLDDWLDSVLQS